MLMAAYTSKEINTKKSRNLYYFQLSGGGGAATLSRIDDLFDQILFLIYFACWLYLIPILIVGC